MLGRNSNLSDPYDSNVSVELAEFLQNVTAKIDIVTVGSLRDIAALYNSSPDLFLKKTDRIWIFAGDAEGTMIESNVGLDETAFLRIMNSEKLDIYWIPCFQNGLWTSGPDASYLTLQHSEVFDNTDSDLLLWFLYRFEKSDMNFKEYLAADHDTCEFMNAVRNIWCTPIFPFITGNIDTYLQDYNETYGKKISLPYGFTEKKITFSQNGEVKYGQGNTIHAFEIYDYNEYLSFSKFVIRSVFQEWEENIQ